MSKKTVKDSKEWYFNAPWGKVALISWGNPANPPVLLLHGYMDSAATFILLVDELPDKYYFVALDMPGHGKSDPFPPGLIVPQVLMVDVIKRVVDHLKWKRFIFMCHSMGCMIGLFYNSVYARKIKRMIFLDILPPLASHYYVNYKLPYWYSFIQKDYYGNINKFSLQKPRLYTQDQAVSLLVRNRGLTEDQAEVVLSRSLIIMGIDTYKLSWDPRMKKISTTTLSEDNLYTILTSNSVPTLSIEASHSKGNTITNKYAENLLQKREETLQDIYRITVDGSHDNHITNPERLVPYIVPFLDNKFNRSKL